MRGFEPGTSGSGHDSAVETATYLLARDEDCENSFHSTADFVSSVAAPCIRQCVIFCLLVPCVPLQWIVLINVSLHRIVYMPFFNSM
jgi:hypothetical protein